MIIDLFIKLYKWIRTYIFRYKALKGIKKFDSPLRINSNCLFNGNTFLGKNTNFNGIKVIGKGKVKIGDNFHSGSGCLIITDVHDYDNGKSIPYDSQNYIVKNVEIEDNVWIGTNVIILGGVILGEGCIVQAGAVVVEDIPKFGIAGGNPAKVFKYRDVEHYKRLRAKGYYH